MEFQDLIDKDKDAQDVNFSRYDVKEHRQHLKDDGKRERKFVLCDFPRIYSIPCCTMSHIL